MSERQAGDLKITPAMVEAGVEALVQAGYGEPGEPREFLRQAAVGGFQAMGALKNAPLDRDTEES